MDYLKVLKEVLEESRLRIVKAIESPGVFKPVSERTLLIDKLAEKIVVDALSEKIGGFTLVSEETGVVKVNGGGGLIAIVDPIDGSTNALRGFPIFSTSLALAEGYRSSDIIAGGVVDLYRGVIYYAVKGIGAFLNDKRITVSKVKSLGESIVSLDVSAKGRAFKYLPLLSPVVDRAYSVRSLGSNALHLCMVASGVFDVFLDLRGVLRAVDASAGVLIVREAGGVVIDGFGAELTFSLTFDARIALIAASTVELAFEILGLLGLKPKS